MVVSAAGAAKFTDLHYLVRSQPLGLLTSPSNPLLVSAIAQRPQTRDATPPGQNLPQVTVAQPRLSRPKRQAPQPKTQAAPRPLPQPAVTTPTNVATPLNTNVVAESGSRLGLTARQIPATVEIVGEQQIKEQGYQTMLDVVKGATGVTAGDAPNDPASRCVVSPTATSLSSTTVSISDRPA